MSFFTQLNPLKSYILGWIISEYNPNQKRILFTDTNEKLIEDINTYLYQYFENDMTTVSRSGYNYLFEIFDEEFYSSLKNISITNDIQYPYDFIRGYYDSNGNFDNNKVSITGSYIHIIKDIISLPSTITNNTLIYEDINILDFLALIYQNPIFKNENKYTKYIQYIGYSHKLPICEVFNNGGGIIPSKTRESDVGYDLSIIKEHKKLNDKTKLYDTGIRIKVDHGYYAEIYPRSSLSKSGYMLANSVGIIDRGYRNNIYIALTKIDENSPDIEFPFRCCQIIFRKQEHLQIKEVDEDFNETDRNKGGFGSTNNTKT